MLLRRKASNQQQQQQQQQKTGQARELICFCVVCMWQAQELICFCVVCMWQAQELICFCVVCMWQAQELICFCVVCMWQAQELICFCVVCMWQAQELICFCVVCMWQAQELICFCVVCTWQAQELICFCIVCMWQAQELICFCVVCMWQAQELICFCVVCMWQAQELICFCVVCMWQAQELICFCVVCMWQAQELICFCVVCMWQAQELICFCVVCMWQAQELICFCVVCMWQAQELICFCVVCMWQAQAEFSPYHLAWSMPRLHGHGFRRRSCSLSASTLVAKNLNTQLLGREDPDETICPTNTESGPAAVHTESYAEPVENMRDRRSSSSDNGSTDSDCSGYIWSFQIPSDEEIARDTPIASEFHSPPQLRSSKTPCGPPGALAYAHEEDEGQEYQPLLAYTVTDYRKNLTMNGVCSMNCNTPSSEKTPASCLDTSSVCHNRSPCPGSHPYNNSVVSKSTLKMFPGTDRRGWDNLELTPQKVQDCSLEETGITSSSCVEECRSLLDEGLEVRCEPQNQEISLDDTINNNDVVLKDSHLLPADSPTDMTSGETSLIACGLISTVTPSSGKIRDANANISNVGGGTVHHSTLFTFDREQTSVGPSSPPRKQLEQLDNFKTPFPVNTVRVKSSTAWSRRKMNDPQTAGLSKSKSSTSNTPRTDAALEVQKTPVLRRSRTLESIYSPAQVYQQLVSVGSASTGSVVSSVSRLSLHDDDDSFMWDNEFSAFNRVAEESLAWEDDPYLK